MATVDDGVRRWDAKFLNRYNRVSFDFYQPHNAQRSETIAKRSKTPLKKCNSLMVLRTIDSLAVSAAPSSVDAISTDDVTSSSCSIDSSPVPTDSSSYSIGKGRRRCLPALPTQETRQGLKGAAVSAGGAKATGLQRKHSCPWPSSGGAANHRLIDGAMHHRLIDGVNHRENDVLGGCFNNGVSRLPRESINLSGSSVNLHRSDHVNHRPHDFVNRRKSDLIKYHPSDTVTQSSTVSSNYHLNGTDSQCPSNGVSVHHQSRSVNQSPSGSHSLHNNLNPARNDSVGHHKSELVIHLQRQIDNKPKDTSVSHQSDIELKDASINHLQGQSGIKLKDTGINRIQGQSDIKQNDASINHCTNEMKTCNTSNRIPQHHSDKIDHFENLGVNLNTSKDETLRRWLDNDCRNEIIDKFQCISDISRSDCATTFKTASARPHDNYSSQKEVVKNNQNEDLSLPQMEKLNPRNTVRRIHCFCDKLNHCPNDRNAENISVPSSNEDSVVYRQKHHQQKLHTSISLDENISPAEREFQVFDGARQRKASLDSKYGAQSKATNSNGIAPMEVAIGSSAKQDPAFLQRQTDLPSSHFDASLSLYDHGKDFEDDHEVACKNMNRGLKQENAFARQGRERGKADQAASDRHGSLNYLISSSHEKPNDSQIFSETCKSSIHSTAHDLSTLSSSYNVTNTEGLRTVLKHHGTKSPIQIAASRQKHYPLTSTKEVPDNNRSPHISEINWTSADDTDLISLHDSPNPNCPTTTKRTTPIVPPCVPTLHALLQTYQMTAVSLVRATPKDDCGVKLTSVPFVAGTKASRRPAGLAPKGKRATKLGSPDGAFRPIATVATSPGRDVQPHVVMVAGVKDGSVAAAGVSIEEGDVVIEVNGTYVLGSTLDAVERLLNINQQHLNFVLAKPVGTASPKPVNGWLSKIDCVSGIPPRMVQHLQDELPSVTPDLHHSILKHVQCSCQTFPENSNHQRQKTIAIRPTKLAESSKWSSLPAYTIRPIQADSAIKTTTAGFSDPDEAYYPSSDSCDESLDSDHKLQKVSAV